MKLQFELGTLEMRRSIQSGTLLALIEDVAKVENTNRNIGNASTSKPDEAPTLVSAVTSAPPVTNGPDVEAPQNYPAIPVSQEIAPVAQVPARQPVVPLQPVVLEYAKATQNQPVPQPIAQQPLTPAPVVPTMALEYTMEQLSTAATQLVDAGKRQDIVNLLARFGVTALNVLPREYYGQFATDLRALGAKI